MVYVTNIGWDYNDMAVQTKQGLKIGEKEVIIPFTELGYGLKKEALKKKIEEQKAIKLKKREEQKKAIEDKKQQRIKEIEEAKKALEEKKQNN